MSRLFESARVASIANITERANQYRSSFEPEEYMLTPLAAAAIFGNHKVVEALLADPSVKVSARRRRGDRSPDESVSNLVRRAVLVILRSLCFRELASTRGGGERGPIDGGLHPMVGMAQKSGIV